MSLRKILERGGELTLILKSGTTLSGTSQPLQGDLLQLDNTYILIDEIAAVTLNGPTGIRTEAELRQRFGQTPVEILWAEPTPTNESLNAALQWFESIHGALSGLEPALANQVQLLRLIESQLGRFAINGNTLEAGFAPDIPAPPIRELQSLLAAIL
jgi:hypothetical protein